MLRTITLASLASANGTSQLRAPDVAAEVHAEQKQSLHISEIFQNLENNDKKEERKVWHNKNLVALVQTGSTVLHQKSPADKLKKEVEREAAQNIQIHEVFRSNEKKSQEDLRRIKTDRNLSQLQLSSSRTPADVVAKQVKEQTYNTIKIHETFQDKEKKDKEEVNHVKTDPNMAQLIQESPSDKLAETVKAQKAHKLQIHDSFEALEKEDKKKEQQIHRDRTMSQLLQKHDGVSDSDDAMDKYLGVKHPLAEELNSEAVPLSQDAQSTSTGGTVTVPLSSQLQESATFLQVRAKTQTKTAPGVEKKVQEESMEDVYLNEEFKSLEKKDVAEERAVKLDPSMKA